MIDGPEIPLDEESPAAPVDPAVMSGDSPVAWRVWWLPLLRIPPFRADPQWADYSEREQAEHAKAELRSVHGNGVVACVTPRYASAGRRRDEFV